MHPPKLIKALVFLPGQLHEERTILGTRAAIEQLVGAPIDATGLERLDNGHSVELFCDPVFATRNRCLAPNLLAMGLTHMGSTPIHGPAVLVRMMDWRGEVFTDLTSKDVELYSRLPRLKAQDGGVCLERPHADLDFSDLLLAQRRTLRAGTQRRKPH